MSEISTNHPIKTYATSYYQPRLRFHLDSGDSFVVDRLFTTDDVAKQNVIEKSDSYKRGWVKIVKVKDEKTELELLEKSGRNVHTGPVMNPEKIRPSSEVFPEDPDAIEPAEPGADYSLTELMQKTVPQLRGILGQQNIKYEKSMKKKELIQAVLRG